MRLRAHDGVTEIVPSAELTDMAVVNTCAVTNEAAADSRAKIRQMARAGVNEIVATGCWSCSNGPGPISPSAAAPG